MDNIQRQERQQSLLGLSHELGSPTRRLAILAEGNTSVKLGADTFLVKASGSNLATLAPDDLVECRFSPLLALLETDNVGDAEVEAALLSSRVDAKSKKPSVEALFHAFFLTLPGIAFVGHTHPQAANAVLCSPRAHEFVGLCT